MRLHRKPWKQETSAVIAHRILDRLAATNYFVNTSKELRVKPGKGKRWIIAVAKNAAVSPQNTALLTVVPLGVIVVEWGKARVVAPDSTRAVLEEVVRESH